MGVRISGLLCAALLVMALAACQGGSSITPPGDNFTRLTAQVLDGSGAPLAGLNVRVEGTDTGVVTDASGQFSLDKSKFPKGIDANNEILLGRGGIVIGSKVIVPSADADITIK